MANEEPLVVVKPGINIMQKVVRKDGHNGSDGMVGKGKAPLCRGRYRGIRERSSGS